MSPYKEDLSSRLCTPSSGQQKGKDSKEDMLCSSRVLATYRLNIGHSVLPLFYLPRTCYMLSIPSGDGEKKIALDFELRYSSKPARYSAHHSF